MWYFTFDHLTSWREMVRLYRHVPPRVPLPAARRPAVLRNHRLCFSRFDEKWGGGVASLAPAVGKSVSGVLFDVPRRAVECFDAYFRDTVRIGSAPHCITLDVEPLGSRQLVRATSHVVLDDDQRDYFPPTSKYIDLLIKSGCEAGLSTLWVEHLKSFAATSKYLAAGRN